ncbi:Gfo/Idh/MocA family protein [Paenibacillus illinoisensis]|uniref:Gfo/Idh/MocA family protein n=1 Tax=Paenibacillus illinoisensis TaxID=59845 RepID=UPI0020416C39|nr:Gfo/Idh/MocA family oxidoreductase [Paenibacillus illinoisensis]MCM3203130.1 Gfo/Idh/MocA family oxidoreductase [Paenibacillus illinoisensis]
MSKPISFGIIGFGWRAEAYLRIAKQLPHVFKISGVAVRNPSKYVEAAKRWDVTLYESSYEMARHCDFLLVAVSKTSVPAVLEELVALQVPLLVETPPAFDEESLRTTSSFAEKNSQIQIAEQYPLLPHQLARMSLIQSGKLGQVHHVQASVAHGYHGISLIRNWLSLTDISCEIVGRRFEHPILEVPYRGRQVQDRIENEVQEIAMLSFRNGKSAVLDFTRSQYFSPLRQNRVLIRGSHGEIRDNEVTISLDTDAYDTYSIHRIQSGMEGSLGPLALHELRAGQECLYRNPFSSAPFSDEELAMVEILTRMSAFVRENISFYPLTEALKDVRLSLAIEKAISTQESVSI